MLAVPIYIYIRHLIILLLSVTRAYLYVMFNNYICNFGWPFIKYPLKGGHCYSKKEGLGRKRRTYYVICCGVSINSSFLFTVNLYITMVHFIEDMKSIFSAYRCKSKFLSKKGGLGQEKENLLYFQKWCVNKLHLFSLLPIFTFQQHSIKKT